MRPLSLYAQSKCDAEKVVLDHPNAVVFRLATVFGISARMRFDLLVNDLVSQLVLKRKVRLYQPHFRRNYVGIRDVARAILWAIEGEQKGVFNLGHPEVNLTKLELARRICDLLQLNPAKTIELVEGEDHDKRDYFVSNEKILQAGFRFEHTLEQGIIEVAELVRLAPELVRQCRNH
jgi:nucleoside-diphosphate-sugar epimerase